MVEPILNIARNIFQQKYRELVQIRTGLKSKADYVLDRKKLKGLERMLAELDRNHRKAARVLEDIRRLLKKKKSKK